MKLDINSLGESELILREDGSIYHLCLQPSQLADTIITVGDPDRVAKVSQYFDSIEHKVQHREFVTHTGIIGGKKISVVSTGIGPDNIDIVLNELDALVNIDFQTRTIKAEKKSLNIIRLGTSGALQEDIALDSVVASSFAIGLDNLMHFYNTEPNPEEAFIQTAFTKHTQMVGNTIQPYIAEGAIGLRAKFSKDVLHGFTVTCPGFYGPQGRVLRAPLAYPQLITALSSFTARDFKVTNFEMETSAIYGLGNLLGHKCLSLSTIVANRITQTFSKNADAAVDKMIRMALEVLTK